MENLKRLCQDLVAKINHINQANDELMHMKSKENDSIFAYSFMEILDQEAFIKGLESNLKKALETIKNFELCEK